MRLRRIRIGWSARELAEAIGVSVQQVYRYEAGSDRMFAATLIRVCVALRTSAGDVCSGLGDEPVASDPRGDGQAGAMIEQLVDNFVAIRDSAVRSQLARLVATMAACSRRQSAD